MQRFWILGLLLAGGLAWAEPAVVSHVEGSAAASARGDPEWTEVEPRRKLGAGDRVWTDKGSRVELAAGRHLLRLDAHSQLGLEELAPNATRSSLRRGSVIGRVATLGAVENFEIGTPNVAVRAASPGRLRVDVDATRGVTQVTVHEGTARVYGAKGEVRTMRAGERMTFAGRNLATAGAVRPAAPDAFDQWAQARESNAAAAVMAAPGVMPAPKPATAPVAQAKPKAAPKPRPPAQARVPTRPATGDAWARQQRREVDQAQRDYENWLRYQNGLPPAYPTREQGIPARRIS